MLDSFDMWIHSDEKEWEYLEWCEILKEIENEAEEN